MVCWAAETAGWGVNRNDDEGIIAAGMCINEAETEAADGGGTRTGRYGNDAAMDEASD